MEKLSKTGNRKSGNKEAADTAIVKIIPDNFNKFSYSRKSHILFFRQKNYDNEVLNKKVNPNDCSKSEYQNLLIYSFIKNNFEEGAKILEIGNTNSKSEILESLKKDYECWRIRDAKDLSKDFTSKPEKLYIENYKNPEAKPVNDYSYFDFVFSMSAFEDTDKDSSSFNDILYNIYRVLKPGGMSVHNFDLHINNEGVSHCNLLTYFYQNSFSDFKPVNKLPNLQSIKRDSDLHSVIQTNGDTYIVNLLNKLKPGKTKISSFNVLLKKELPSIAKSAVENSYFYLSKHPVYIFHHIPKTGGQALALTFRKWFKIQVDYFEKKNNINDFIRYRLNTHNLASDTCIVGHFTHEGTYVHQRYPEVIFQKNEFKLFTFIRDPLQTRISLYFYLKNKNLQKNPASKGLVESLLSSSNVVSRSLICDESNYKEVLDRYFFIGIFERMQESVDKLASLLGKKKIQVMSSNKSSKDSQISQVTPEVIEKFKQINQLDYLIYNYCLDKFNKL